MKLTVHSRTGKTKSETKQIRRQGDIPAIIYSGEKSKNITIVGTEFIQHLRTVATGHLPTTVFSLSSNEGVQQAIIKDIQYDITTYKVTHLDFQSLAESDEVTVKVPIQFTGVVDCVGLKLGGALRQVIRHMRVRCKKDQIPSHFELDVRDLSMRQSKRLRDIALPEGMKAISDPKEVAVVVVKR